MVYPGKPEDKQVTKTIQVKVTPEEHEQLKKKAKTEDVKLSAVGRDAFLNWLDPKRKKR